MNDGSDHEQPEAVSPPDRPNFQHRVIEPLSMPSTDSTPQPTPSSDTEPDTYESFSSTRVNHAGTVVRPSFAPLPSETKNAEGPQASNVLANIFVTLFGVLQLLAASIVILYATKLGELGFILFGFGALGLIFSIFLLLRRDFARQLSIVFQVITLLGQIYNLVRYIGHGAGSTYFIAGLLGSVVGIGISIAVIVILTRPSVKALFR